MDGSAKCIETWNVRVQSCVQSHAVCCTSGLDSYIEWSPHNIKRDHKQDFHEGKDKNMQILVGKHDGKRQIGRQRRWWGNIKNCVEGGGCEVNSSG